MIVEGERVSSLIVVENERPIRVFLTSRKS
jgi:hypothetical protein